MFTYLASCPSGSHNIGQCAHYAASSWTGQGTLLGGVLFVLIIAALKSLFGKKK